VAVVNAAAGFAPPVWLARPSMIQWTKPALRCARSSEFVKLESWPLERKAGPIDIEAQTT